MSSLSRRLGWTLVGASLLLHILTVYCFSRQPEKLAAFTVMPIWLWGGIGLFLSCLAFYFLRASLSLIMTAVWIVTLLVGADEARVLANFGKSPPLPGAAENYDGSPVMRVVTMNTAFFRYGNPSQDIASWQPDVVLLQDIHPHQVRQIADVLYGGHGDYRTHQTNGIVTRWKIQQEVRNPDPLKRNQQITIERPDGARMEVVNVHLASAATDLRLWRRSAWVGHRNNRRLRVQELSVVQQVL
ncbi:MAG: hypothetical protein EOP85_03880, partial [Verrucomicrobiaceae bacterium]